MDAPIYEVWAWNRRQCDRLYAGGSRTAMRETIAVVSTYPHNYRGVFALRFIKLRGGAGRCVHRRRFGGSK